MKLEWDEAKRLTNLKNMAWTSPTLSHLRGGMRMSRSTIASTMARSGNSHWVCTADMSTWWFMSNAARLEES